MSGPDYVAMTAGEAKMPRTVLPLAFKSVFYRLTTFFVLGSLCIGIIVPYNDPDLVRAISDARPGAGASPYTIAMNRLGVQILPHIINAFILSAVYSAGNSFVYCASRTLFGLALEGKMPRFLTYCTARGVPIYCVGLTLAISLLAFLQVSHNASVVLTWYVAIRNCIFGPYLSPDQSLRFVNLVTASQLLNYATIAFTYIRFYTVRYPIE